MNPVTGDGDKFSCHIMRIFDSDGNGFLDFKEFLMAIDIATCQTGLSVINRFFFVDIRGRNNLECLPPISLSHPKLAKDKHSSLFGLFVIDTELKFDNSY